MPSPLHRLSSRVTRLQGCFRCLRISFNHRKQYWGRYFTVPAAGACHGATANRAQLSPDGPGARTRGNRDAGAAGFSHQAARGRTISQSDRGPDGSRDLFRGGGLPHCVEIKRPRQDHRRAERRQHRPAARDHTSGRRQRPHMLQERHLRRWRGLGRNRHPTGHSGPSNGGGPCCRTRYGGRARGQIFEGAEIGAMKWRPAITLTLSK